MWLGCFWSILSCFWGTTDTNLDVSHIPVSLIQNASAVVRYEHSQYTIRKIDDLSFEYQKAVTILNEKGEGAGNVLIHYTDDTDHIDNLKIEILNAKGKIIKKVKRKEISDESMIDGFSLKNDSRIKNYRYTTNSYPYTIRYRYTKKTDNTLEVYSWYPISYFNVSVQESTYKIENKAQLPIHVKPYGIIDHNINVDVDTYSFSANNLSAIRYEKRTPRIQEYIPHVRVVPSKFNYYGKKGEFTDWKTYGKWVYKNMLSDRNDLLPESIEQIKKRLPADADDHQKAKIIYQYVVDNMRYVSVQVGVGGLMPFKCSEVYQWKYGDCKALSFYTAALLNHFDIEAIYTEIASDKNYAVNYTQDFANPRDGNHIILCLPMKGDTIWAECTSNDLIWGYVHQGITDRQALMIKKEGGQLVNTKAYSADENIKEVNARLSILGDGSVDIHFKNKHSNSRYESMRYLYTTDLKQRDKYLKMYAYPQLNSLIIKKYGITIDSAECTLKEEAHFETQFAEKAGDYLLIPYNIIGTVAPTQLNTHRKQNIYIKESISDVADIEIKIPDGYTPILSDKDAFAFNNEFGSVTTELTQKDENTIHIQIKITQNKGHFEAEYVSNFNAYADAIFAFSKKKIVLKSKK